MATNQTRKPENTENWSDPNWNNWNWNWNNWGNQMPNSLDFNKLRNTASKNIEAASSANQVALESIQAISRRTAEVLQQNARHGVESFKEVCSSKNPGETQANHINNFMQNYCSNAKEIADIASKATLEIVEIFSNRMSDATKEICANCK